MVLSGVQVRACYSIKRGSGMKSVSSGVGGDLVTIQPASFVVDNSWVTYNGGTLNIRDHIRSVLGAGRTKFFVNKLYSVYLLVCLNPEEGLKVIEGEQVPHTSSRIPPPPRSFNDIPLIGLILTQDGSRDLIHGYKPVLDSNIIRYSGIGNVIDKDQVGDPGEDSLEQGPPGLQGETGLQGITGLQGVTGLQGEAGPTPIGERGERGLQGPTGLYWDVNIPFDKIF